MTTTLRLGTRRSALAQAQSQHVIRDLRTKFPELTVELVLITTSGDQSTTPPKDHGVGAGGLKTLFTKELEDALLDDKIDLAVHSMKDLPSVLPQALVIGAVPRREDPRDVWISKTGLPFAELPEGATVGTGAVRRQCQLKHLRPDLTFVPIRGNVDSRLQKLKDGPLDGLILAYAGLLRLGRESVVTQIFDTEDLAPAVGQGALAIEIRQNDSQVKKWVSRLNDLPSESAALAERDFLHHLGGSCQTPIAAYARKEDKQWVMDGVVASFDGKMILKEQVRAANAKTLGKQTAQGLLNRGAGRLLKETSHPPM